jgi:SAM-dependent methyltransferase
MEFEASLMDGYDVVTCQECGFGFADNIPEQAEFDKYYAEYSKYDKSFDSGKDPAIDTKRYEDVADIIQANIPNKDMLILDIGCATGELLSILKARGYRNVVGLDPSPTCREAAKRLYGIAVHIGSVNDLPDESEDVIIMTGTLEHIRDLDKLLNKILQVITINGYLVIQVPDAIRFSDTPDVHYQQFSMEHINYFSQTSLDILLRPYGFEKIFSKMHLVDYPDKLIGNPQITAIYQFVDEKDDWTKPALERYAQTLDGVDVHAEAIIENLVLSHVPIIVWGTGSHTLTLLSGSGLTYADIRGFVDSNPGYWGKKIYGRTIMKPADIANYPECSILVSSRTYQQEIVNQIKYVMHLNNRVITLYRLGGRSD